MVAIVTNLQYDSVTDSNALTCTLASLATSSGLLVGREATAVTNVSTQYPDVQVFGQIMTGTSPTAGVIEVWAYGIIKHVTSTPTYPSPITGSDAAVTFVAETKVRLINVDTMATNATSNTPYAIKPTSLRQLFGIMPVKWGLFVVHNTAVNLNATAGNHWLHWQGIKYQSN
jgi:hypothetical protein